MARFKYNEPRGLALDTSMSLVQLAELQIQNTTELRVVNIPSLPEGVKPKMSGFWNAMSKRKHFRLRRRKYGN